MKLEELKKMVGRLNKIINEVEKMGLDVDVNILTDCLNCGCGVGIKDTKDFSVRLFWDNDDKERLDVHL